MKIASSQLLLASQHASASFTRVTDSASLWIGDPPDSTALGAPRADRLELSPDAAATHATSADQPEEWTTTDPKYVLVRLLLERFFGASFDWIDPRDFTERSQPSGTASDHPAEAATNAEPQAEPEGWGMTVSHTYEHGEAEVMQFQAAGQVVTEDGQTLSFTLSMGLSRQFYESRQTEIRLGDDARPRDPLVVNYAGQAAELTDRTFEFDLDADGTTDRISFAKPGSAFLAVDRNGNGRIDDGSELFGPSTGDGWAELAAADDDGNGWIDENDAVFSQLRLWTRDGEGHDQLTGLLDANVGAIGLAQVATAFDYTTPADELLGQARSTGLFLREDGSGAGTVQQIDLVA